MQQYFLGRVLEDSLSVESLNGKENLIIANQCPDKEWDQGIKKINHSTFAKMGFKGSTFTDCDFKFNIFIDCYFKNAKFNEVNFTGCKFINCNFDYVTISNSIFDYANFENCVIKYNYIKESLPQRANIRFSLCKKLSIESLKLADSENYRNYFFDEKKSSEEYNWKKFWHPDSDPYYKKYNWSDQMSGLFSFFISKTNKLLWGYGEKLSRLIFNILVIILLFSLIYLMLFPTLSNGIEMNCAKALYISLSHFFTLTCEYSVESSIYNVISVVEGGLGVILTGFFIAALFRNINRRG